MHAESIPITEVGIYKRKISREKEENTRSTKKEKNKIQEKRKKHASIKKKKERKMLTTKKKNKKPRSRPSYRPRKKF